MHVFLSIASCLLMVMLLSTGASARPLRQLQQQPIAANFVPPASTGCDGLVVTVTAEKSHNRWWHSVPVIEGTVQLQNPKQYGVPVSNIFVQAVSSEGQFYSAYATCDRGAGTFVPTNPVPYTYGTLTCSYRIQLDNRVFGSYGSSSGSSNGLVGYIPHNHHNRPTWTVQATATIALNNAQCSSAPAAVNTSSWWSWFTNIIGSSHGGSSSSHGYSESSAISGPADNSLNNNVGDDSNRDKK